MHTARLVVLGTAALLLACGGENPLGPHLQLSDLVGNWTLTRWEYTAVANSLDKTDWVQAFDLTGSLAVTSTGAFTVTPRLPGGFGNDFGTLTVDADSIYWDGEDDEQWVGVIVSSSTLILDWREVEFLAPHRDGSPTDVRLIVAFRRQ
jgi:hypothetical protein